MKIYPFLSLLFLVGCSNAPYREFIEAPPVDDKPLLTTSDSKGSPEIIVATVAPPKVELPSENLANFPETKATAPVDTAVVYSSMGLRPPAQPKAAVKNPSPVIIRKVVMKTVTTTPLEDGGTKVSEVLETIEEAPPKDNTSLWIGWIIAILTATASIITALPKLLNKDTKGA